jgi:cytoskeletal protein RodZ
MKKTVENNRQAGFAIIGAVLIIVTIGMAGGIGWQFQQLRKEAKKSQGKSDVTTAEKNSSTQNPSTPTAAQPGSTSTQNLASSAQSASPKETVSATVLYRVSADGTSAQVSPVTTILKNASSVELTIDLNCLGNCQFRLVSDGYGLSDTKTYTSSQKIKYTLTKPGSWVLYNNYTPSTKFKVSF